LIQNLHISPLPPKKDDENGSNHGENRYMTTYDLLHNETVSKNFGKYRDQFVEFKSWLIPGEFFFIHEAWIKSHTINQTSLPPFDYIKYSDRAPKIHTPDRLESELVSIKKTNDFVYEG